MAKDDVSDRVPDVSEGSTDEEEGLSINDDTDAEELLCLADEILSTLPSFERLIRKYLRLISTLLP